MWSKTNGAMLQNGNLQIWEVLGRDARKHADIVVRILQINMIYASSLYLSIFAYNDISLFSLHQFKRITRLSKTNIAFGVKTIEENGLIVL